MRSYAEVAAPPTPSLPQQPKQPPTKKTSAGLMLHQQISSIASQLGSMVSDVPATQDVVMATQEVTPTQESHASESEKQVMVEKIRQLELSLSNVPTGPECKHIRDAITHQIEQAKAKINSSKPLAARLEGCQDALNRSQKRLAETESLVQLAMTGRDQANAQVAKYQAELTEVQALIARQAESARGGHLSPKAALTNASRRHGDDQFRTRGGWRIAERDAADGRPLQPADLPRGESADVGSSSGAERFPGAAEASTTALGERNCLPSRAAYTHRHSFDYSAVARIVGCECEWGFGGGVFNSGHHRRRLTKLSADARPFVPGRGLHHSYAREHSSSICGGVPPKKTDKNRKVRDDLELNSTKLVQANVCTLHPGELKHAKTRQNCGSSARMISLDDSFAETGACFVCVQEGRAPGDGLHSCRNFRMYRSGADPDGSHGVQVWVLHKFVRMVTAVNPISSRLLHVVVQIGPLFLHVISAHAPIEAATDACKEAFWSSLQRLISSLGPANSNLVLVGIDANALQAHLDEECKRSPGRA